MQLSSEVQRVNIEHWLISIRNYLDTISTKRIKHTTEINSQSLVWQSKCKCTGLKSSVSWTNQMELDVHFVRDKVLRKEFEHHVPFSYQTADLLTKPLDYSTFLLFRDKLEVIETHSILKGGVRIDELASCKESYILWVC